MIRQDKKNLTMENINKLLKTNKYLNKYLNYGKQLTVSTELDLCF